MRHTNSLSIAILLLFGLLGSYQFVSEINPYLAAHEKKMQSRKGRIPKKDRIDLAWAQEREMTMDPETGEVPTERLIDAWYYMKSLQGRYGKAAIPGINWQPRGPVNCGGRTRAVCIDLNDVTRKTVWTAGVNGGLWKTTDITASAPNWTPINDFFQNLAITYIDQAPGNPNIMYFCTGEGNNNSDAARGLGVWKSTNGGNSWIQLSATNNSSYHYCQKLFTIGNGDTVFVATRTGLYRSTNGGTSFTRVLGTSTSVAYDIERAANRTLYATISTGSSGSGAIHKSFDGGATWTAALTIPSYVARREIELALADNDTNTIWGLVENASRITAIIRSGNAGLTWDTTASHPIDADPGIPGSGNPVKDFSRNQAWYDLSIAVDPNNSNVCFVGGIDLFKTSNSGSSWTQISHWYGGFGFQEVHADQHYAIYSPGSSTILYFVNDGGIYRTDNATATTPTIVSKETNYITAQFYACDIHPGAGINHYLAGAQDNGSHLFNAAGLNNTAEVTGGDGAFCHIDQNQPQFQFTSYVYNNFYRSVNTGSSFTGISFGNTGRFINPTEYDDSLNVMYAALSTNNYLRWNDPQTGSSSSTVTVTNINSQVSSITASPNVPRRVYFGLGNGRIVRIDSANTDLSKTGVIINSGVTGFTSYVNCIAVEKGDENHIIGIQSNYGVTNIWETKNGGTSWVACDGNLPDMPVRWVLLNPTKPWQAIIATELGVWSTDSLMGSATIWEPSNNGLANTRATMLKMRESDKQVIVSTHGRGLYSSDIFMDPYADFSASRTIIYEGQGIQFNNLSGKATSSSWNFGDATSSTLTQPFKVYTTPGIYTVTLQINGGGGAQTKTISNYITVLPYRGVPYTLAMGGNFDINPTDFVASTVSGTAFVRGSSTTSGKAGTRSGSFAWVTGLSGNYADNSVSYLYTPNFNFTASGTYTVRFYCRNAFEIGYDGFRVEYTLDTGLTWIPLGTSTSSGWYDFANSTGGTAFPAGQAFFNANNTSFTLKSFTATSLQNNARVGFRFVFRSDESATAAGVAIDDFEITGPANNPLPVTLLSFTAKRLSDDDVKLNWLTSDEKDFSHYEIQRKLNWSDDFAPIKSIDATHNLHLNRYEFNDVNTNKGLSYYRLKMIDMDGSYTYSNTLAVSGKTHEEALKHILVPVNGYAGKSFKLHSSGENAENIDVTIVSNTGQQVWQGKLQSQGIVNLSALSSGVYFVRMKLNDGSFITQKLLVH
ncbi:MAG: PKD domain-containing protein [Bacteroidota bacterium]